MARKRGERFMRPFDFTDAIVRSPGRSVIRGIRSDPHAVPDFDGLSREHAAYVASLREAGVRVDVLPPLETFPDSTFVEDPALVFPNGAILLRPGAQARLGEKEELRPTLKHRFEKLLELSEGAFADGGDVLVTPGVVYVGLSGRTNVSGAQALLGLLAELELQSEIVETPPGVLHLKSAVSLLDEETVLATAEIAQTRVFERFRMVELSPGDEAAANAVRVGDTVLVNGRFPRAMEQVARHGLPVTPLYIDEVMKLDAGLSCMSLRWSDYAHRSAQGSEA